MRDPNGIEAQYLSELVQLRKWPSCRPWESSASKQKRRPGKSETRRNCFPRQAHPLLGVRQRPEHCPQRLAAIYSLHATRPGPRQGARTGPVHRAAIAEKLGGQAGVKSRVNQGNVFYFTLLGVMDDSMSILERRRHDPETC
jgi:hypothetical protein